MGARAGTVVIIHRGTVVTSLLHWVRTLPGDVGLETPEGTQIPAQRNAGAARGLDGAWVLFVDSDQVPLPTTLPMLLSRGVDVVSAVVCERVPPWRVCAMEGPWSDELRRVELSLIPRDGVRRITAAGTGCLLVRRAVFERVPYPWFQCGQIRPDLLMEDVGFCRAAAAAGFGIWLDCGARVGHDFGGGVVRPGLDGRPWIAWKGPAGVTEPVGPATARTLGRGAETDGVLAALLGARG